jgi:hypothetical protein
VGTEEHFLSMLRVLAGQPVGVVTIAADSNQATETLDKIRAGVGVTYYATLAGFSDSISSGGLRDFFVM